MRTIKLPWSWAPLIGAIVGCLIGAAIVLPGGHWDYGFGLFVFAPATTASVTTVIAQYAGIRSFGRLLTLAFGALALDGVFLLFSALEGLSCLLMGLAVIAIPVLIGVGIGYGIKAALDKNKKPPLPLLLLLLIVPPTLWDELHVRGHLERVSYSTTVVVKAAPSQVWNEVIHLGALPPAHDLMSITGLACPETAELKGYGVGAERDCRLSTGFMKERITGWVPGRTLSFVALETPPPMKETNPFGNPHPDHLKRDYFRILSGGFSLVPLSDGTTRLTRTTVFEHQIRPFCYWTWLSDIAADYAHHRVLDYIKARCEDSQVASR